MPSSEKKNLLGRTVVKSNDKTYNTDGYSRSKSKVVLNKEGDILKTKSKTTKYKPVGELTGKLQGFKESGTTVTKKKYSDGKLKSTNTRSSSIPVKAKKK
jgi:hypothetical protein